MNDYPADSHLSSALEELRSEVTHNGTRALSIAITNLETAMLWLYKHRNETLKPEG